MRTKPNQLPDPSRSVVLPSHNDERLWMALHIGIGVTALLFVLLLTSCKEWGPESVDYGPEVSETEVLQAVSAPLANANPNSIKVGEFVHMAEVQELAGGQLKGILSETGQTVIDREEDSANITLTVVETKVVYSNGDNRKTSTEFPVVIKKATTASASTVTTSSADSSAALSSTDTTLANTAVLSSSPEMARILSDLNRVRTSESKATYHNLHVTRALEPAPELVRTQPGCLGLPDCKMDVHRVSFDQVIWDDGTPNRIHFDYAMSPDAPFMAQVLDKCLTLLVPITGSSSKTLLKQCTPVVSFRFEAAPQ